MLERSTRWAVALCLLAGTAGAMGGGVVDGRTALSALQAKFPGARAHVEDGRIICIYGTPMTGAATPSAAAEAWITRHGAAFGVGPLDLREVWSCPTADERFTVFAYQQYVGGLPVELSVGRILVLNGQGNPVVYAAGQLSAMPANGFAPITWTGPQAVASVQARPAYANMPTWTDPELVAYDGRADGLVMPLTRAWKFRADAPDMIGGAQAFTFFVDAATGALLFARNEILNIDVSGKVTGKATPGTKPDSNQNLPVEMPLESIRAAIQGGNNAYTDVNGDFTISHGGNQQVNVSTSLANGRWVKVTNNGGAALSLDQNVMPPGPANFLFNAAPSEFNTAQVNAFIHQTATHDYFKSRAPGFNGLDTSFTANCNLNQTCNAYYDGNSTNFFRAGGGCVNTAYSTVVNHEYGHHIVNRLFLAQGAFGEGYADTTAIMIHDVGIVGQDFCGPGCHVRNIDTANKQYPCGGEAHDCGQVLAGVWRDTAINFKNAFGTNLGLELARQLCVDWSLITVGGVGGQAASPTTAIEALTANDDDGNLANGTPDYALIAAAFKKHNIDSPPIELLAFQYPDGTPTQLAPGKVTKFRVNVVALTENPQPGTGELVYRIDGGQFTTVAMTQDQPNQYTATLPAVDCLQGVDYYVQAKTTGGTLVKDPQGAPASFRSAIAFSSSKILVQDAFETDTGWTAGAPGDTAVTGVWTRMDPLPTDAQPGDDHTPNGTICWVTDGRGGNLGDYDVDGGKTTLLSPIYDLAGAQDAFISYWRWYSNDTGNAPNADVFRVDVSNDGGQTWKNAETVGPGGPETHAGWFFHQFTLSKFVAPSKQVRLRFIAEDAADPSLVEAAVDDFAIEAVLCGADCYPDCDGNGGLDLFDFLCFVNLFNAGDGYADCDGNGGYDLFDFLCFVNSFNEGC